MKRKTEVGTLALSKEKSALLGLTFLSLVAMCWVVEYSVFYVFATFEQTGSFWDNNLELKMDRAISVLVFFILFKFISKILSYLSD